MFVFIFVVFVAFSLALLESDVGIKDWHIATIGAPVALSCSASTLFLGSATSVAALDVATGDIAWSFAENGTHMSENGRFVGTTAGLVGENGRVVSILGDFVVSVGESSSNSAFFVAWSESGDVFSMQKTETLWSVPQTRPEHAALVTYQGIVFLIGVAKEGLSVGALDGATGRVLRTFAPVPPSDDVEVFDVSSVCVFGNTVRIKGKSRVFELLLDIEQNQWSSAPADGHVLVCGDVSLDKSASLLSTDRRPQLSRYDPPTRVRMARMCGEVLVTVDNDDVVTGIDMKTNTMLWQRFEALAHVLPTPVFVDLPVASSHNRRAEGFMERITWQWEGLMGRQEEAQTEHETMLTRDKFGFEKLLVLRTQRQRLYALLTTNGALAWSRAFVQDGQRLEIIDVRELVPATLTSAAGGGAAVLGVVALNRNTSAYFAGFVSAADGSGALKSVVTTHADDAVTVPRGAPEWTLVVTDHATRNVRVHVLDGDEAGATQVLYRVHDADGGMRGMAAGGTGATFDTAEMWEFVPPTGEEVVAHAASSALVDERIDAPVRVLRNLTALYKYTNANRVVLVTKKDSEKASDLFVNVLDSANGMLIHRMRIAHASGPVLVALADHTVTVTYRNTKARRFDILVSEFYERQIDWSHTPLQYDSALHDDDAWVVSRSMALLERPTAIYATQTAAGIAHRQWLIAFESGRVYAAPHELMDVGVEDVTSAGKPAQALPPILPIVGTFVASHTRNLGRDAPNVIAVAPTRLESTCIAVATGGTGGVFVWRVAPSGSFDVLTSAFGHTNMMLTVAAVCVTTLVVRHIAMRKQVDAQWKD